MHSRWLNKPRSDCGGRRAVAPRPSRDTRRGELHGRSHQHTGHRVAVNVPYPILSTFAPPYAGDVRSFARFFH